MRLRRMRVVAVSGVMLSALVTGGLAGGPAGADIAGKVVSANPVDYTPHVRDGQVNALVKIGNRIFVGGSFTQVKEAGANAPVLTRNRLFSFNADTGAIDTGFVPDFDKGEVSALLPAPDGQSLYVGGSFSKINGTSHFVLGRIDASSGAPVAAFKPQLSARVRDLRLAGGRLYVAGAFAQAGGVSRPALATVNPTSGALDDFADLKFAGNQTGDDSTTLAYKMDVTPDGNKLVVVGNFNSVAGQTRNQIAMIDLTGAKAQLSTWNTTRYADQCSQSFDTYMRDIDFSPDGSYFVVSTTGAYGGTSKLCDTQVRWETSATGPGQQPTWIAFTGGDTSYAVEVTDSAVYVGGHFRWNNNPLCNNCAGQGAVSREGIAALDPANGLAFSWNPGRIKGVGVFDLLVTSEGLWMGSDTDQTGGETHQKLAMFPYAGGTTIPKYLTGTLPGNVYSAGGSGFGAQNYLRHRSFDGSQAGTVTTDDTAGLDWRNVRGAFMINGVLYYGNSADGKVFRRSFNGTTLGTATEVNAGDEIVNMSTWHGNVKSINGMFFSGGKVYYTRGTSALYYRYFNPQNGLVGTMELTAVSNLNGVNWSSVGGMFVAGGRLYYVNNSDGRLYSLAFTDGVPSGSPALVNSGDWRGRAVFLFSGVPNDPPTAAFTADCTSLNCSVNGSASSDSDGSVASYAWDFGDGATGTGATAAHTYAASGTYQVKLTVTDDKGATGSKSQSVTLNQTNIGFRGADGVNGNLQNATVKVPSGVQAGDAMLLFLTSNSPSVTVTPPAGWTQVGTQATDAAVSTVWKRVAVAGDAGKSVTAGFSAYAKVDLRILAYEGTSADPVVATAKAVDPASVTAHHSPTVTVGTGGAWTVTYWGDKSSTTTAWTAPAGVTTRGTGIGTGSGRITALVTDSGGTVPTGSYGGLNASTDAASRALMWTVVLAPKSAG